jgi:YVTN family beta-propeller protein
MRSGGGGLVLAPDLGRLYASASGRNQVAIIDTSRLAVIARVPTGTFPDGLAYVSDYDPPPTVETANLGLTCGTIYAHIKYGVEMGE